MKALLLTLTALLTILTSNPNTADARFYFHNNYGFGNSWFNNWYSRFPQRRIYSHDDEKKDTDIIDIDDYIDRGVIVSKPKSSSNSSMFSSTDMRKKQEDMQKEMEKRQKEMAESFSKLTQPKEENKLETLPQKIDKPSQELPKHELQQQTLQPLPELPKLEPAKLPDLPQLPQQQQLPSMESMQSGIPKQEEQTVTRTDPNKEPAKINIEEHQQPAKVIAEEKKEETGFHLSNKTLIIMALVFLGIGVLFVLSK